MINFLQIICHFIINHLHCQDPRLKSLDDGWQDLKGLNHTTIRAPPAPPLLTIILLQFLTCETQQETDRTGWLPEYGINKKIDICPSEKER